jgi:aminopeptidase N
VIDFVRFSNRPVVDSVSSLMDLLNANSYQKGAWVIHMLRRQMGDSSFKVFIQTYYWRYKGINATTEDLCAVVEEVTHKDWHLFFKQWLYTPGIPQLLIQWQYTEKEKTISVTVIQRQKGEAFQFPLQLKFQFANGKTQTETLYISKQAEIFDIPVKDVISDVLPDPNISLLFNGKLKKIESGQIKN